MSASKQFEDPAGDPASQFRPGAVANGGGPVASIGIDLGTSNTWLHRATGPASRPEPIILPGISGDDGGIATTVLYEDGQAILIGSIAVAEYFTNDALRVRRKLASQFKPELSDPDSPACGWMTDFLRLLLAALPGDLAGRLSGAGASAPADILQILVGIPSRTREDYKLNLANCFRKAGWPEPAFVRESDAALIACLESGVLGLEAVDARNLVLDFGGGTCDFTLLDKAEVMLAGGDPLFGGRLFDDLFFQLFCRTDREFASAVPGSRHEFFTHWIACRRVKEDFSAAILAASRLGEADQPGQAVTDLHLAWLDKSGRRHDSFVHNYSLDDFVRDAEHYQASPGMLEQLAVYSGQGGISLLARDLLEGREIGLISWLGDLLEQAVRHGERPDTIVLTGGSSRWFFVRELAQRLFPGSHVVLSPGSCEDIGHGLALHPWLVMANRQARTVLEAKIPGFAAEMASLVRQTFDDFSGRAVELLARRIVERDVMPVLEQARDGGKTIEQLEKAFADAIAADSGLTGLLADRIEEMRKNLDARLSDCYARWLRQNGVRLAPVFSTPASDLGSDLLAALRVRIADPGLINIMDFMLKAVLPALLAYTVAGAIAHFGALASAMVGGGAAFAGAWGLGRVAGNVLRKCKLPGFLLNQRSRNRIAEKNRQYIQKALAECFASVQTGIAAGLEPALRQSLASLVARLGVLNQVSVLHRR